MTRTVFDNAMVAHVWAQQNQAHGRSNNGNFWFEHESIYSYRTAMATFLRPFTVKHGERPTVFLNRDSYSVSTSAHQSYIRQALSHDQVRVYMSVSGEFMQHLARSPDFFNSRDADPATRQRLVKEEVARNITEAQNLLMKAARARSRAGDYYRQSMHYVDLARRVARMFKVRVHIPKNLREAEAGTVDGVKDFAASAIAADEKRRAKIRRDAERQARKQRENDAEIFRDWLTGIGMHAPASYRVSPNGGVYMRKVTNVHGDESLQTSQGAAVPWRHAVRVFQALKAVRASGQPWQTNGRVLRVGHFQVDRIEANGDFKAGCHNFKWDDIEPFAIEHGVFDIEASDAAIQLRKDAA